MRGEKVSLSLTLAFEHLKRERNALLMPPLLFVFRQSCKPSLRPSLPNSTKVAEELEDRVETMIFPTITMSSKLLLSLSVFHPRWPTGPGGTDGS
jgi:hypothetical protein